MLWLCLMYYLNCGGVTECFIRSNQKCTLSPPFAQLQEAEAPRSVLEEIGLT